MMRHSLIPIILLFMLAAEGVAMELLPSSIKFADIYIIPHWILMFLVIVTTYAYQNQAMIPIVYAGIFGLMIDIVYTGILGVYMFVVPLALYIAQLLNRSFQANIWMVLIITSMSLFVLEVALLIIYSFLGISTMDFSDFILYRFFPTLLANLVFILVIYYPSRKILAWIDMKKFT